MAMRGGPHREDGRGEQMLSSAVFSAVWDYINGILRNIPECGHGRKAGGAVKCCIVLFADTSCGSCENRRQNNGKYPVLTCENIKDI
jgi:hypothetical protein